MCNCHCQNLNQGHLAVLSSETQVLVIPVIQHSGPWRGFPGPGCRKGARSWLLSSLGFKGSWMGGTGQKSGQSDWWPRISHDQDPTNQSIPSSDYSDWLRVAHVTQVGTDEVHPRTLASVLGEAPSSGPRGEAMPDTLENVRPIVEPTQRQDQLRKGF